MIQEIIAFSLNAKEKILIELEVLLRDIHCCSKVNIFFISGQSKYLVSNDSLRESMYCLAILLEKALANNLQLHDSIESSGLAQKDIGYLYNEYCQQLWNEYIKNRGGFSYEKDEEGRKVWVGYQYRLWCYDFQSWIYNDSDGNIIFEMTPMYTTHYDDKEFEYSVLYEQWIKDYKPFLKRKIPRNVAQEWLLQANKILQQLEENVQRMLSNGTF